MRISRFSSRALAFATVILAGMYFFAIGALRARSQSHGNSAAPPHGVELSSLDRTCKPCEDFYPLREWFVADKESHSCRVSKLGPLQRTAGTEIARNCAKFSKSASANHNAAAGSNEQKIGDYYASCMDVQQIDAAGAKPLQPRIRPHPGDRQWS